MKNKALKRSPLSIVLYVLSAVLLVYAVYMVFSTVNYLSSYFQTYSTTIGSNLGDSFNYILTNTLSYFLYAVFLFTAGKVYDAVRALDSSNFESEADLAAKKKAREDQKKAKEDAKAKVAAEKAKAAEKKTEAKSAKKADEKEADKEADKDAEESK